MRDGAIWSVPAEGGAARQLTTLDCRATRRSTPIRSRSPAGARVLFSRLTASRAASGSRRSPLEGGRRSVVVERATTPVWSPTGHLLFAREGRGLGGAFRPGRCAPLWDGRAGDPGRRHRARALRQPGVPGLDERHARLHPAQVRQQALRLGGARRLRAPPRAAPGQLREPRVSPDGRRVAIEETAASSIPVDLARGTRAVAAVGAVGEQFRDLDERRRDASCSGASTPLSGPPRTAAASGRAFRTLTQHPRLRPAPTAPPSSAFA